MEVYRSTNFLSMTQISVSDYSLQVEPNEGDGYRDFSASIHPVVDVFASGRRSDTATFTFTGSW